VISLSTVAPSSKAGSPVRLTTDLALAADGYGVESTPGSLARWGYELYGGSVLSDASLREMTDFFQDPCCDMRYGLGAWDLSVSYGTLAVATRGRIPSRPAAP
jgi:hypothetical protein